MSKTWCFTLNNFTVEEYDEACDWLEEETKYAIVAVEFGEERHNPHLQGYFRSSSALRCDTINPL